jgi:hypothetical protein
MNAETLLQLVTWWVGLYCLGWWVGTGRDKPALVKLEQLFQDCRAAFPLGQFLSWSEVSGASLQNDG